jgi:hypothetical protein
MNVITSIQLERDAGGKPQTRFRIPLSFGSRSAGLGRISDNRERSAAFLSDIALRRSTKGLDSHAGMAAMR